ncbi:MAG: ERAP1-like C-terminal domain-containing protein [Acidobacteriia bacterium]|nr:ERAP1-like C-terminal domain-containing protein [Terriglobia bacterium]
MANLRLCRLGGLLLAGYLCSSAFADQAPTLRLPETVAPESYRVELKLDPSQPNFSGSIAIRVNIKTASDTIWLNANHITVEEATFESGGNKVSAKPEAHGDDFLALHFPSPVPAGSGEVHIRYTGAIRQQDSSGIFHMTDNGNDYLFTQFEQIDARAAFPCFDEPSYKVPWQLTLDVPENDTAVSNTSPQHEETRAGRKIYTFAETKPLPSYLIAFGVGPFDYVEAGKAGKRGVPVRIVTPKGHASEAKYAAEVTATILTRLEEYFGIPYPYDKSDQLSIPVTFGFGAMENAGLVTYGQTIILADPARDTLTRQREYATVAAHELAHQWFGDLVTMEWWNDIWLNEAFASWMEQKLVAEWKPEWHTRVEDVDSKLQAEDNDSLVSARKIRQEINSKDDISNAFDSITYNKGAAVIGMFENWMGAEKFRTGVHAYLQQYAFKNATAPEFLDSVSSAGKKNISQPFETFLNQAGVPLLSVKLLCSNTPVLHIEQKRYLPLGSKGSTNELWGVPVCVRYGSGDQGTNACTLMSQASMDWKLPKASGCPAWVEANDNAIGYYRVDYEHRLLASLTEGDVVHRLNAPERVDFMGNAASLAKGGTLPAADALALVGTFHDDPEHDVVQNAAELALEPYEHLVPQDLEANYQRFLLKNFQARAKELGWAPKPGEDDNARLLRPRLVRQIATYGGDQELASVGRQLADKWFNDHNAVDASMVSSVLGTAAYYGDKALFERFLAELKKTQDRQERARILEAMGRFQDPAALEAGMQAVISGEIPFMEAVGLLFAGQTSDKTRKLAFDFMKSHFDEIAKKRPTGGGFDAGSIFPYVGASFCDAQSRDELKSFFASKVDQFTGAPRVLQQVLESIDVCIANKDAQEPSVIAFLKHY